jgi:hypothetical protein
MTGKRYLYYGVHDAVENDRVNLLYRPRCGGMSVPLALLPSHALDERAVGALSLSLSLSLFLSPSCARVRCCAITHCLVRFLSRLFSFCLSSFLFRTSEFRSVSKCVVERGDLGHCPAAHVGVHLARTFECTRQRRKIGGDPCV